MGDHGRQVRAESHDSQTAKEFIDSQLQLEADAREALPYAFDHCTQPLGPLRQNLYSCLTCNPPPKFTSDSYTPAGVCYSCSIACHGEHELVELFNRRNFTCDCGTTRLPATSPCTLRLDPTTGVKGPVHSQPAAQGNTYNKNFKNRFCGCGELYDAHAEKGTMFQCLGLAGEDDGGCGEDWWHPECILGLGRGWNCERNTGLLTVSDDRFNRITTGSRGDDEDNENHDDLPPGFPREDEFETFICYKCVGANPWIRRYADRYHVAGERTEEELGNGVQPSRGNVGLLPNEDEKTKTPLPSEGAQSTTAGSHIGSDPRSVLSSGSLKRKAEEQDADGLASATSKKSKVESTKDCYYDSLPDTRSGSISLFLKEDFRDHFCRCAKCYLDLRKHPQLLEEEESYEPPMSESDEAGGGSVGTGSLLDRGEAALNNVDRVRAIEGVMVYNHLKDKVKSFLQPFAESGQAVGAEDIKAYFEKLRGDERAIKAAATTDASAPEDDNRREQSGY
ncbi:MAG: hypothetical protein Q9185_004329 [Variospora sp. 1 TL-2023]